MRKHFGRFGLAVTIAAAQAQAQAHEIEPVPAAYACPVPRPAPRKLDPDMVDRVSNALDQAFDAAMGPDAKRLHDPKVFAKVAARTADERRMAALADVTGCAALVDERNGCALYFDTELGNPLSVFMRMKRTAPMRRQFEQAVARIPDPALKRAAQGCIRLIGTP